MGKITANMSARDKARWVSLTVGVALMVVGIFVREPLNLVGKTVTDNAFLVVGAVGVVIALGIIQAVKAVKGQVDK